MSDQFNGQPEAGFYWVKVFDGPQWRWEPAEFADGAWRWLRGGGECVTPQVIGERILPPSTEEP